MKNYPACGNVVKLNHEVFYSIERFTGKKSTFANRACGNFRSRRFDGRHVGKHRTASQCENYAEDY